MAHKQPQKYIVSKKNNTTPITVRTVEVEATCEYDARRTGAALMRVAVADAWKLDVVRAYYRKRPDV